MGFLFYFINPQTSLHYHLLLGVVIYLWSIYNVYISVLRNLIIMIISKDIEEERDMF